MEGEKKGRENLQSSNSPRQLSGEKMGKERKSKLSSYMWYTSTSLRLVGLWPSGEASSNEGGILHFLYIVFIAVGMIVQVFQMLTNCWINYTNFASAAESIGPMMALLTAFSKMCIYHRERARHRHLVKSLENCLKNGPIDVLENLENYGKIGSVACGSLLGVTWLVVVLYLGAPLLVSDNILPFAAWYPFNIENSTFLYAIAYSHEVILTCMGCCIMTTEITFVWSIFHCCARLKVLREKLTTLSQYDMNDETFSNSVGFKLSSLTKLHCEVLRDVEEINHAYTYIVMVLFFTAIIAICCAGLQITGAAGDTDKWTTGLFLVLAIYYAEQLLFYYLPGEILAQEAMAVSFAAYSSGWELLDLKHQKTIGLIIMRSHLPPRLLVGQLSPLRLENYNAFLTTTASYFTSIRAVTDE